MPLYEEILAEYGDLRPMCDDLPKDKQELIAWANDKKIEFANEIFDDIEKLVEDYSSGRIGYSDFVSSISEAKAKYTESQSCTNCKHLLSCEPNPFGICDQYEKGDKKIYQNPID